MTVPEEIVRSCRFSPAVTAEVTVATGFPDTETATRMRPDVSERHRGRNSRIAPHTNRFGSLPPYRQQYERHGDKARTSLPLNRRLPGILSRSALMTMSPSSKAEGKHRSPSRPVGRLGQLVDLEHQASERHDGAHSPQWLLCSRVIAHRVDLLAQRAVWRRRFGARNETDELSRLRAQPLITRTTQTMIARPVHDPLGITGLAALHWRQSIPTVP